MKYRISSLMLASFLVALLPASAKAGETRGSFNVDCYYHHTLQADPIVSPGAVSGHLHDFFGNTTTNADSTYLSLTDPSASTTCELFEDRAGYWNPTARLGGGQVFPIRVAAYYFGVARSTVETIPDGLQMIGGRADAAGPGENPHVYWNCSGETPWADHPYRCSPDAGRVQGRIEFPSCWDGIGLRPQHVAYPAGGSCPSGFSHRIAKLSYRVRFPITDPCLGASPCSSTDAPEANITLSLSSGPYYTLHADFWNTWNQARLGELVDSCLNTHTDCGGFSSATNSAPRAGFAVSCSGLVCSFADTSSDPDGIVVGWNWSFGDGATASGTPQTSHTYGSAGTYTTSLSVIDNALASDSAWQRTTLSVSSVSVPGEPALSATGGPAAVQLSWAAPADGGSPITNYNIYRGTTTGGETLLANVGNVSSYEDKPVSSEVTYFYQVSAVNGAGEGARSNEASATPLAPTIPETPILTAKSARGAKASGVDLSWTVPADGGSAITAFRIYRRTLSGTQVFLVEVGNIASYRDTTTTSRDTYFYKVSAVNAVGEGPLSNEASARAT